MWRGCASGSRSRVYVALGPVVLGILLMTGAGVADASGGPSAFSAPGSGGQVYVTGLGPGARMSLLNPAGRTIATGRADSLGGLLFRNVRPGSGYRVSGG